jgi:AcrR family transcriptional regulator
VRGVPKVVDHEQRRRELVAATWTVIADEGIEAATIRRIAEEAGCTTGRITHYFEAKEAILVAALRAVHQAAAARMATAIADGDDNPREALRLVLLEALPLDAERRIEWRVWLAFWGRAAGNQPLRKEQAARYAEWRALIMSLLAADRGEASAAELRVRLDVVAGAVDGLGLQAALEPARFTKARLRAAVDGVVATAFPTAPRRAAPS